MKLSFWNKALTITPTPSIPNMFAQYASMLSPCFLTITGKACVKPVSRTPRAGREPVLDVPGLHAWPQAQITAPHRMPAHTGVPSARGKEKERICRKAGAFFAVDGRRKGRKSTFERRHCHLVSFVFSLVQRWSSPRGKAGECKGAAAPNVLPPLQRFAWMPVSSLRSQRARRSAPPFRVAPAPASPAKARLLEGMVPKNRPVLYRLPDNVSPQGCFRRSGLVRHRRTNG